jgi:hypothetical protein
MNISWCFSEFINEPNSSLDSREGTRNNVYVITCWWHVVGGQLLVLLWMKWIHCAW